MRQRLPTMNSRLRTPRQGLWLPRTPAARRGLSRRRRTHPAPANSPHHPEPDVPVDHILWAALPAAVYNAVRERLGTDYAARTVDVGANSGTAAVLTASDGRRIFVKGQDGRAPRERLTPTDEAEGGSDWGVRAGGRSTNSVRKSASTRTCLRQVRPYCGALTSTTGTSWASGMSTAGMPTTSRARRTSTRSRRRSPTSPTGGRRRPHARVCGGCVLQRAGGLRRGGRVAAPARGGRVAGGVDPDDESSVRGSRVRDVRQRAGARAV